MNANHSETPKGSDPADPPSPLDALIAEARPVLHSLQAGVACTDDGDGSCSECHVALVECDACGGLGYHRDGCVEVES